MNYFLQAIKKDDSQVCNMQDFPSYGMFIKLHQKQPILRVFNTAYQSVSNAFLFGQKNKKSQISIFMKISMYNEKNKRFKVFSENLNKAYFFRFKRVQRIVNNGKLYLSCSDKKCDCKKQLFCIGPFAESQEIVEQERDKIIQNTLLHTSNIWNFHDIPNIFKKVEKTLSTFDQGKLMKIYKNTEIVFAYNSYLDNIQLLSRFRYLTDLDINDNPNLTSLKGIQNCSRLKNLNCSHCNISTLNEICHMKHLQYINLNYNRKITNFNGIQCLTELKQVFLSNTSIKNTAVFIKAKKLQYLDLEDCKELQCVGHISSDKLIFVNISGCYKLKHFNLAKESEKSLKKVHYQKDQEQVQNVKDIIHLGIVYKNKEMNEQYQEQEHTFDLEELLVEINNYLYKKQYKKHMGRDDAETAQQFNKYCDF